MAFHISKEEIETLTRIYEARFQKWLHSERFLIDGRVEPGFIGLDIAIAKNDESERYSMEFRVALEENHLTEAEGRDLAVDFAEFITQKYFDEGRDLLLPLDYQPYEFGDHVVYARGDLTHPKLDAWADAIIEAGMVVDEPDGGK